MLCRKTGTWHQISTGDVALAIYLPLDDGASCASVFIDGVEFSSWKLLEDGWSRVISPMYDLERLLSEARKVPSRDALVQDLRKSLLAIPSQPADPLSQPYDRAEILNWRGKRYQRLKLATPVFRSSTFRAAPSSS
jgi:hypothetical protein